MGSGLDPEPYPIIERNFRVAAGLSRESVSTVSPNQVLHVMSYNLLANRLATLDKFSHTTRAVLHFSFRGPRIIKEIASSDADVICMQELDRYHDFY